MLDETERLTDACIQLIELLLGACTGNDNRHNGAAVTGHEHELFDNVDVDKLEAIGQELQLIREQLKSD